MNQPSPSLLRRLCLPAAATTVFLLFYLGAQPFAVGLVPEPWDKLAHFVVFGGIAGLLAVGTARPQPLRLVLLVSVIGALDEWHQVYLPGRSADVMDLATDVAAAIVVVTAIDWLRLRGAVRAAGGARRKERSTCAES
ncbi:MAG TPA: VanZ family protein [Rhodocyclaceae bacterium]